MRIYIVDRLQGDHTWQTPPPIKSSLQSKAFTEDITIVLGALGTDKAVRARLSACLASDGSHITPQSNGEHVAAIQRALMAIKTSPKFPIMSRLPAITDPPGFYGPMTVSAVLFYKAIYHIQRTGQPLDNITGRGTITQLDNDMLEIESGSQPKPAPPSPGNWTFVVPNLPIIIKDQDDDPAKGDLQDKETSSEATRIARVQIMGLPDGVVFVPTASLCERTLLGEIGQGGSEATKMADPQLLKNTSAATRLTFPHGHFWSRTVAQDRNFKTEHETLSRKITRAISGASNKVARTTDIGVLRPDRQPDDLKNHPVNIDFSFKNDPLRLAARDPLAFAFGAIQGLRVSLTSFSGAPDGSYTAILKYEITDHFGADNGDVYSKGQAALYMLQRGLARDQDKGRYKPYASTIVVDVEIKGDAAAL